MFYKLKNLIPQRLKNIYHFFKAFGASVIFGFPSRKITVVGVTGTNGKTTTVQLIGAVLKAGGYKVAVSSTINFKIGEEEQVNKTKFTTLSSWRVQKFISKAVREDCDYLVLEVSSHALDQNRTWGIDFDVAVFTNLTREHLDYHKNMGKYGKAKEKLFALLKEKRMWMFRYWKKDVPKTAIINLGNFLAEKIIGHKADLKFGYRLKGLPGAKSENELTKKIIAKNFEETKGGASFRVDGQEVNLKLKGKFNVENALAAYCVGLSQGVEPEKISRGLASVEKVPGRMEHVENDRGLSIIVDYALTPDSMEKLGKIIQETKNEGRIFWIFGSCGERDRGKRPMMGEIASRFADFIILTNEDPYHEDPNRILDEIETGVINSKSEAPNTKQMQNNKSEIQKKFERDENYWKILDRGKAIKKALQMAKPGDVVLVTGKGAEETMAIGNKTLPWNDKQKIEEILDEK